MNAGDKVRLILYRCHEKGLEVLLIESDLKTDDKIWRLPSGQLSAAGLAESIALEDYVDEAGNEVKTLAIETDWHQIPSIRGIIKHDVKRLSDKIKKVSGIEQHTYHNVKDALKRVLPEEYAALKELKDIIVDRNQARMV